MALLLMISAAMSLHAQTVEYYHTDALGTPIAVTDSSGDVIQRSEYAPYGGLLNGAVKDGPGYTGHVSDAATELVYMQQRYYDPGIGVFLSADPVGVDTKTAWNICRYCYAANNPYKFTDPDGRMPESVMDRRYVYSRLSSEQVAGIEAQHNEIGAQATAGIVAGATEVVGAKGLGFLVKGLRVFRAWRVARTTQAPAGIARQTTQQLQKSQRSLQGRVAEHRKKLNDYKSNPDAHDNVGALANAPNQKIRQQIIEGRINALEGQISKNIGELKKVTEELSKR